MISPENFSPYELNKETNHYYDESKFKNYDDGNKKYKLLKWIFIISTINNIIVKLIFQIRDKLLKSWNLISYILLMIFLKILEFIMIPFYTIGFECYKFTAKMQQKDNYNDEFFTENNNCEDIFQSANIGIGDLRGLYWNGDSVTGLKKYSKLVDKKSEDIKLLMKAHKENKFEYKSKNNYKYKGMNL